MASTSLQDFVAEQRTKSGGGAGTTSVGALGSALKNGGASGAASLFGGVRSTINSGLVYARLRQDDDGDAQDDMEGGAANKSNSTSGSGSYWNLGGGGESVFGLSRFQRVIGFVSCLSAAMFCFGFASFLIPVIVFKSRKFAALNTLGSCFLFVSFALLWGPLSFLAHIFEKSRLPVTLSYLFSVLATLYTSLWISNTLLTLICAGVQAVALLWFILSYVPGGERGLRFMSGLCGAFVKRQSKTVLPI